VTIRVLYHREPEGWWAESPEIEGWTVAGESYEAVRTLVEDGVTFALAAAAEDRGDDFDEGRRGTLAVEHFVPAPA
jgi:predicted RNase H-like HicB family nuclease